MSLNLEIIAEKLLKVKGNKDRITIFPEKIKNDIINLIGERILKARYDKSERLFLF